AGLKIEVGDAEIVAVGAQCGHHLGSKWIDRLVLVLGRNDVIDRRERALRIFDRQPEVPKHPESLRRSDLVDEVSADEKLCASVGQSADGVAFPNFLVEALAHGADAGLRGGAAKWSARRRMSKHDGVRMVAVRRPTGATRPRGSPEGPQPSSPSSNEPPGGGDHRSPGYQ